MEAPSSIYGLAASVDGVVQLGNASGEGWFLTAEMMELIEGGIDGIACLQPFACLPNHVTGKGVLKEMRLRHPEVPISAIDFDPGASEVNQENRLKLLVDNARRKGRSDKDIGMAEATDFVECGEEEGTENLGGSLPVTETSETTMAG